MDKLLDDCCRCTIKSFTAIVNQLGHISLHFLSMCVMNLDVIHCFDLFIAKPCAALPPGHL